MDRGPGSHRGHSGQHTSLPLLAHDRDKSHGPSFNGGGWRHGPPASRHCLSKSSKQPSSSLLHGEHTPPYPTQPPAQGRVSGMESSYCLVAPLTPEPHELKQWVIHPLHTLEMQVSDNKSKAPSGANQNTVQCPTPKGEKALCESVLGAPTTF